MVVKRIKFAHKCSILHLLKSWIKLSGWVHCFIRVIHYGDLFFRRCCSILWFHCWNWSDLVGWCPMCWNWDQTHGLHSSFFWHPQLCAQWRCWSDVQHCFYLHPRSHQTARRHCHSGTCGGLQQQCLGHGVWWFLGQQRCTSGLQAVGILHNRYKLFLRLIDLPVCCGGNWLLLFI